MSRHERGNFARSRPSLHNCADIPEIVGSGSTIEHGLLCAAIARGAERERIPELDVSEQACPDPKFCRSRE